MKMQCKRLTLLAMLSGITLCTQAAQPLFSEDYEDGDYQGWSLSGAGSAQITSYAGNESLRLTRARSAQVAVSTQGFSQVSISMEMAASYLEYNDSCVGEVSADNGNSWQTVVQVVDGMDDGVTLYQGQSSHSSFDDNAQLLLRVRAAGNQTADYCWADNILLFGEPTGEVFDGLSGNGNVSRSLHTYSQLLGSTQSLVDYSAFALPVGARNPDHEFSGLLTLSNESSSGQFTEQGTNLAAAYTDPGHLPEFSYEFVQHGTHLIPVQRGLVATSHPSWSYILSPGRVWQENSDSAYARVALPFALQENGANCTHNGVMTFLFKSDGSVSNLAYQISSETCAYFKFNMWGKLPATYEPYELAEALELIQAYEAEVTGRMPVKALSSLSLDYPEAGLNIANVGSELSQAHRSVYGVVYQGVHYLGQCSSRTGNYPYCEVLALPSYSTAKSVVGGIGLMRLEQIYQGSQKTLPVSNWVSQCNGSQWQGVTFEHLLDMATGNYDSSGFEVDEASNAMLNGFFLSYTHSGKIGFSCSYARKSTPGTAWVYHSSDTYILGSALDNYHRYWQGAQADFYQDVLVEELWLGLGLSPTTYTSLRTFDTQAQAYSGYGLTYLVDDVVKLADFLNKDDGKIQGVQMLEPNMLAEAMQQTSQHGLDAGSGIDKYQNGFWAWNGKSALGCANDSWIPYMSGYGGIGVVMLPGDMTYYFFSDNQEHSFVTTVQELSKLHNYCQ